MPSFGTSDFTSASDKSINPGPSIPYLRKYVIKWYDNAKPANVSIIYNIVVIDLCKQNLNLYGREGRR